MVQSGEKDIYPAVSRRWHSTLPQRVGTPNIPGSTGHGREETGVSSSPIRNHWKDRGLLHTDVDKDRNQSMPKRKWAQWQMLTLPANLTL